MNATEDVRRSLLALDLLTLRSADRIDEGLARMEKICPLNQHEERLRAIAVRMREMVGVTR